MHETHALATWNLEPPFQSLEDRGNPRKSVSNWPYIRSLIRGYPDCVHSVLAFATPLRGFSRACLDALQYPFNQRDLTATIRRKKTAVFMSRIVFVRPDCMKQSLCIKFCAELEEMGVVTYS